jgi:hypothetical protein
MKVPVTCSRRAILLDRIYARDMDGAWAQRLAFAILSVGCLVLVLLSGGHWIYLLGAWAQPVAFTILFLSCLVLGILSADSRPGFSGAKSNYKETWFPHSRND